MLSAWVACECHESPSGSTAPDRYYQVSVYSGLFDAIMSVKLRHWTRHVSSFDDRSRCLVSPLLNTDLGTSAPGAIWSQVEIAVGIISTCLPVYRPLFTRKAVRSRSIRLPGLSRSLGGSTTVAVVNRPEDIIQERPFMKLADRNVYSREHGFR